MIHPAVTMALLFFSRFLVASGLLALVATFLRRR